jgi:hypothetical protein
VEHVADYPHWDAAWLQVSGASPRFVGAAPPPRSIGPRAGLLPGNVRPEGGLPQR